MAEKIKSGVVLESGIFGTSVASLADREICVLCGLRGSALSNIGVLSPSCFLIPSLPASVQSSPHHTACVLSDAVQLRPKWHHHHHGPILSPLHPGCFSVMLDVSLQSPDFLPGSGSTCSLFLAVLHTKTDEPYLDSIVHFYSRSPPGQGGTLADSWNQPLSAPYVLPERDCSGCYSRSRSVTAVLPLSSVTTVLTSPSRPYHNFHIYAALQHSFNIGVSGDRSCHTAQKIPNGRAERATLFSQ